jgi:hypothetical protein
MVMATRNLSALEKLLIEVAICAPSNQNKYAVEARIPWRLIERIRSELDQMEIDWRHIRKEMHRIQQERRA